MMPAKNFPIFHIFCSILFAAITSEDPWRYDCELTSTWSTPNNSTTIYRDNFNALLTTLSSNAKNQNGFFNSKSGRDTSDTAYGMFLCRGDVSADICKKCVTNATKDIVKSCPFQKEAAVCYDYCMLRYSDKNIFGTWYQYFVIDSPDDRHNVSEPQKLDKVLANLMNELETRVANDDRKDKKFATQEANFTHGHNVLLNSVIISSKNLIMFSKQVLLAAKSKGDKEVQMNFFPEKLYCANRARN
ncbi:cysteine-rich receptor-like protein kinase 25 [Lycium ferocissimum]|uniref:cysteine-rich receptor-like protein kinase 25 n=1 Tax=Lycium ferocissimum TaxID=112874 RepID=UPI002815F66E|nr:cysteine-rich receptor-like protein kinase 25 [Lycium ferocissimum]